MLDLIDKLIGKKLKKKQTEAMVGINVGELRRSLDGLDDRIKVHVVDKKGWEHPVSFVDDKQNALYLYSPIEVVF